VGRVLQRVINPIVLTLLYCVTILPAGVLMRWRGRDPLRLSFDPGARSYWVVRDPPGPAPETMRNQF
jgi:hypothetical protein